MDIILISRKDTTTKSVHIKWPFVIVGACLLVAVIVLFLYNAGAFMSRTVNHTRLNQLHFENKVVREELETIEQEFANLTALIDSLQDYDKKLRIYASLEPLNDDVRHMGVGGIDARYDNKPITHRLQSNLEDLSQTLDQLLARSQLQKASFTALLAHLEEKKYLQNHTPSIIPVQGWFISGFGYRIDPFTGEVKLHEGLDIAAPPGTPIVAPADGVVRTISNQSGFGLTIELEHGYGFVTRYAHCQRARIGVGSSVKRGDIIAYVGSTGKSTGPHLHYEVRVSQTALDPVNYIITAATITD